MSSSAPGRTLLRLAAALAVIGSAALPTRAQTPDTTAADRPEADADSTFTSAGAPLIDVPIRRTEYRVGPGDVIGIAIFGAVNRQMHLGVNPEGILVIPRIGLVRVQDLTVEEAESEIREAVFEQLRNVEVFVTLTEVRRFNVFVLGHVPQAGVRSASAVTRVSELLADLPEPSAHRRITIRRANGDSVSVDLARFTLLGDLDANPMLREGDAVIVPAIDERVRAFGRVPFPGAYEYVPGETLAEFLTLVMGGQEWLSDAADSVRLARFVGTRAREVRVISTADAVGSMGQQIRLQPFDAVYVPSRSNYMEQHFAEAQGQVVHPGTYPIEPGITTVSELLAMAGGLTEQASLAAATLRRTVIRRDQAEVTELERMPPELLSEVERGILEIESRGDATNVVVDFEALLQRGESALDQPLQPGDVLFVPRLRNDVVVLGAVHQPGIVPYSGGDGVAHYVRLAGGFSDLADRGDIVVLKGKLGTRLSAREAGALDPGDTVIVPFRERRTFIEWMQDISSIVTPITALVLTVIALDNAL